MLTHKIALAGAAAAALLVTSAPALAFTHHPATPAEIQATDDLNAKALADARAGTAGTQPTASTNPLPSVVSPTTAPDQNMTAPTPSPDASAPMPAPTDATPAPSNPIPAPNAATPPTQPEPPVNGQ